MNLLLFYGQMTATTRARIEAAISAVSDPCRYWIQSGCDRHRAP